MAVLVLSCVFSSRVAPAQSYEPAAIEEIQVTATRRPTEVSNVSAALTLISFDEIHGAKLTTDGLAVQIGVYLQQTTPGHRVRQSFAASKARKSCTLSTACD